MYSRLEMQLSGLGTSKPRHSLADIGLETKFAPMYYFLTI